MRDGAIQAAVERKTLEDLTSSLVDGSLQFALGNLAELERAVVVIEAGYAALLKVERVPPGFVLNLLARLQVRFHVVPLVFAGSRKFAEEIHLPLPRRRAAPIAQRLSSHRPPSCPVAATIKGLGYPEDRFRPNRCEVDLNEQQPLLPQSDPRTD